MKIREAQEIIEDIKSLKIKLVKSQDYYNASLMRDMEKEYLNKETE